ncbi:MAG: alternative ribosome rescue aminoacyl-tRNA hydrolase ArfB [Acidimicrobiales bacterium]|jgi:ribosome-associated protein
MSDGIFVNDQLTIPEAELDWRFTTSSGPGGQHANKAHTRAELTWNCVASPTVTSAQRRTIASKLGPILTVKADDERSQHRNREIARERLGAQVRGSLVQRRPRRKTKPSRGSKERRLKAKQQRSDVKRDRQRPGRDD